MTPKKLISLILIIAFVFTLMPVLSSTAATEERMPSGYRFLLEPILDYDATICFHDGTACVQKDGKFGYIDKTGELVVPLIYDKEKSHPIHSLPDDNGLFQVSEGIKMGYKDIAGKMVIPAIYRYAAPFHEGLAVVQTFDNEWGFIDQTGTVVIPLIYDFAYDFNEGVAPVRQDGKWGYINKAGNIVVPLIYDYAWYCSEGVGCVQKNGKWGILEFLKVGDSLGDVLYSDIVAYINGEAIPTSVINGKTLVVVEDLLRYGFDVKWDDKDKTLKVELNKNKKIDPLPVTKDTAHKSGAFKCKYLYTDIKTYLSGVEAESYAINGVTLIDFELLKKYGKLTWDGKTREIRLVIGEEVEKVEAYYLYKKMIRTMADVKSIDMDMSLNWEYDLKSEVIVEVLDIPAYYTSSRQLNGNMKKIKKNDNTLDMELNFQRTSHSYFGGGPPGHIIHSEYISYYTDGIYYEDAYYDWFLLGDKSKMKMSAETVIREIGIDEIEILDFPLNAISEYKIIQLNDGNKKIEFILNGEWEITEQILKFMQDGFRYHPYDYKNAALNYDKFICEVVIDKNNMMKSYDMICDVELISRGENGRYIKEINIGVNSYNDVKINFPPDLDSYTQNIYRGD